MPNEYICPKCGSELELDEAEQLVKKTHCPECESMIDFNQTPPKIIEDENYVELLSTFNQGDISIIKSILENYEIDYNVLGENFLSVDPLIQPVRFYVNEDQVERAKEVLKDIDINYWGASN